MLIKRRSFSIAVIITAIVVSLVVELTYIYFSVAMGFAIFIASLIEDEFSIREGVYVLLGALMLLLVSYWLAYIYDETLTEFTNNDSRYLNRIPFYAVAAGVWGSCLLVWSLIRKLWTRQE